MVVSAINRKRLTVLMKLFLIHLRKKPMPISVQMLSMIDELLFIAGELFHRVYSLYHSSESSFLI
jgi:hypothetical protein